MFTTGFACVRKRGASAAAALKGPPLPSRLMVPAFVRKAPKGERWHDVVFVFKKNWVAPEMWAEAGRMLNELTGSCSSCLLLGLFFCTKESG